MTGRKGADTQQARTVRFVRTGHQQAVTRAHPDCTMDQPLQSLCRDSRIARGGFAARLLQCWRKSCCGA